MFDYVFSITSGGETSYWLFYNNLDYNALNYIKLYKEKLGYVFDEDTNNDNLNNESSNENEEQNVEGNSENTNNDLQNNTDNNDDSNNENNGQEGENNQTGNPEEGLTDVQKYNSKFESYAGEHSKGSIRSLLDSVQEANLTYENKIQVEFNGAIYVDNVSNLKEQIVNNIYMITIEHNTETGYIQKIIIN